MKQAFNSIIKILTLSLIIFFVTLYFIYDSNLISWVIFGSGILCLISLLFFRISINSVWPDIVFGLIDNGILAILAIFGGEMAGMVGAVVGGVVGNALTDGIAGIFEGLMAEKMKKKNIPENRTMMGSSVGKMTGCLLGAGLVLIIAGWIDL